MTLNGGSSSIRLAIYEVGEAPRVLLRGKLDRIGLSGTNLAVGKSVVKCGRLDHGAAVSFLLEWLEKQSIFATVAA